MPSLSWMMILVGLGLFGPDVKAVRQWVHEIRMQHLLHQSDGQRIWSHGRWVDDRPTHIPPDRVHGGIGP